MSSSTIYVFASDPDGAIKVMAERAKSLGIDVNSMTRQTGGQEWTRLILGTHNFVRQKNASLARDAVLRRVASATVAFGIGVSPQDGQAAREKLSSLMSGFDSMLFDGWTMLDGELEDLLRQKPWWRIW